MTRYPWHDLIRTFSVVIGGAAIVWLLLRDWTRKRNTTEPCPTCIGWGKVRCVRTGHDTMTGEDCPQCEGKGRIRYEPVP